MPQRCSLTMRTGHCAKCRLGKTAYFLPGQSNREVTCRRCHLPLAFGPETLTSVWMTKPWLFLPITRRIEPLDFSLFTRREELLKLLPPWEWTTLGLVPSRVEHELVVVQAIRSRCDSCGTKTQSFCLTEYARRRLACSACGRPTPNTRATELRAGLEADGACYLIGSLSPLSPVIIDRPSSLAVLSPDDLELLGVL